MKREDKKKYYVPSTNSTKYEFLVAGVSAPITIIREEDFYYQVEHDGQKKALGNVVSTCQYLYRCQAQWFTKENRKKRMFYHYRSDVMQMLREGYTVVHIESGNRISYTEDYSRIVCSSTIVLENDVPPGNFCIDFTEPKLAKTYNEVKAEQLFARVVEEEKLEKERKKERESEARREAARKLFEKSRKTAENSKSVPQPEPVEDKSSNDLFFKIAGAAAMFLGGLGLGILIKN